MMAIKSAILPLFFSIDLASGIILPGPCPPLRPSDQLMENNLKGYHVTASLIATVPLVTRKSYLFRDIVLVNDPHCHYLVFSRRQRSVQFKYGHPQTNCPFSWSKQVGQSADNASLILESEVGYAPNRPSNCGHIQEEARFWFLHGGAVIVWSCVELKAGKEHDEAVLLVVESLISFDDDTFGEIVNKFRLNIDSYLKTPLLENIIWPNITKREICPNKDNCNTSNCMDVNRETQWNKRTSSISVLVIVGLFLISSIGMLLWNIYSRWNKERVDQVVS